MSATAETLDAKRSGGHIASYGSICSSEFVARIRHTVELERRGYHAPNRDGE